VKNTLLKKHNPGYYPGLYICCAYKPNSVPIMPAEADLTRRRSFIWDRCYQRPQAAHSPIDESGLAQR